LATLIWVSLTQVPAPDYFASWEQAGIVTVLVAAIFIVGAAFLRGWVVPKGQNDRERERADKAEAQNEKLREAFENIVRAYERLATEAVAAERDATTEVRMANVHLGEMKSALELLKAQLGKG
jgi:uncharacterized protein HemX